MRKLNFRLFLYNILLVVGLLFLPTIASADGEHTFSLIGVKCPIDDYVQDGIEGDDLYYTCMLDYIDGLLDTYVIGEGDNVDPGTTVMFALQYTPGSDLSAVAFNTTLTYDPDIWASVHDETDYYYDEDAYPKIRKATWTVSMNTPEVGRIIITGYDTANEASPLTSPIDLYYIFLTLNEDITPGQSVAINFGQVAGDTDVGDANNASLPYKTQDLTLSVYGNESQDASLKTLTVMNGTTSYFLEPEFTPGNADNTTYSVVVPNNIDNIDIGATVNNEYATILPGGLGNKKLTVGDNSFEITVSSQLGNTEIYYINVYRLSNDATLSNLTFTNGISIGSLEEDTYTYTVNDIAFAVKNTTITALPNHEFAYIDSGDGSWTFETSGDTTNVREIVVKAENCLEQYQDIEGNSCTSQTYTINVNRIAASDNSYLKSLTVDNKSVPSFNKETLVYNLDPVSNATTSINIGAVVEDTGKANIISGTGNVNLNVGDNNFKIVVKAEDGSTSTYEINVRRLSSDKRLSSLEVTSSPSGTLSPTFSSSFTGEYTYTYDPTVTSVTVSATVNDTDNAKVFIADTSSSAPSGTGTSNTASENFDVTVTQVSVVVTAEDGSIQIYPINLTRLKSSNNYLSSLSLSDGTLSPTFKPETRRYTASVDGSVDSVEVYAEPAVGYGKVISITGNENLQFGQNTIEIVVQAENGDEASYYVDLTREKYDIATLKDLTINGETIDDFKSDKYEYTLDNVGFDTKSLLVGYTTSNEYATVSGSITGGSTGSSNVSLNTKDNQIILTVTAHNGTTKKDYKINVYREQNNDNSVHGITVAGVTPTLDDEGNYVVTLPNSKDTLYPADIVVSVGEGAEVIKTTTLPLITEGTNTYPFSVTNEKGEPKNYTILVTREKSTEASISKVILTIGDDSSRYCLMEGDSCTIGVPVTTTSFSLSALISDKASISPVNGTSYEMPSNESTKTITLTVTSENDDVVKTYDVIVERQKSSDNSLSDLQVNGVTVPNFSPDKQVYNVTVPGLTDEVSVSATVSDTGKASIETDLSNPFSLDFGSNQIDVVVKAENNNSKTYTIFVTREAGIDATLSDLQVNTVTVSGFDPDVTNYLLSEVDYNTTFLNVLGVPNDSNASVDGDGLIELKTGENEIKITVSAHNPDVTKVYVIKVTRTENNDTGIQSIELSGNTATYNSKTGNYEVTVPNSVTEANVDNVKVTVNNPKMDTDAKATYKVTTTPLLTTDTTTVPITVTAEDGTVEMYSLVVTREQSKVATLKSLTVTDGSFNPSFSPDDDTKLTYNVTVPVDMTEFDVTATPTDSTSKISGTGHYTLSSSTMTVEVVVVSEDLSTTNTYVLNISRTKSSVNTLKEITVSEGALSPEFSSTATSYTVMVDGDVDEIEIGASVTDNSRAEIVSGTGVHSLNVGNNPITIRVQSESGSILDYTVNVIRAPKTDNYLFDLTVDGETVPGFDKNVNTYNLTNVSNSKTSIEIGAKTSDPDARVTGTGIKGLKTGLNTFNVVVTAQNGTINTYQLNIVREPNNNANLRILGVNGYVFKETFSPTTYYYEVEVASNKETLSATDITAVAENANATIEFQETIELSTTDDNYYDVTVYAENCKEEFANIPGNSCTSETYTIKVIRPPSSDAKIKEVNITGATIYPTFSPTTTEYTLSVPYGKTDFSIVGIPNDPKTTVLGSGDYTTSNRVVTLTAKAEDGTIKTYTFNITQALNNDATLSDLSVQGYPISPKFASTTLLYDIGDIVYGTEKLVINATPKNADATIEYYVDNILQSSNIVNIPSTFGTKTITVKVIAADGTTSKSYNITYNLIPSSDSYLSKLEPSQGSIEFVETKTYYELTVENEIEEIEFELETRDNNASVTFNGESFFTQNKDTIKISNLRVGNNTVSILVTAQDGTSKTTYNIVVKRLEEAASTDAYLRSLSVTDYPFDITFDMEKMEYSIGEIPYGLTELTINASANMGTSSIKYLVNGVEQSNNVVTIPKENGTGIITVQVIAEDGKTTNNYKITYKKEASSIAYLSRLVVTNGTLNFNKTTYNYEIDVDSSVTSIDLTAATEDDNATMKMNGTTYTSPHTLTVSPLNAGKNEVVILVTAENGNVLTYKVTINRAPDIAKEITSVEFGHTIEEDYIKTVKVKITGLDLKNQLDNENQYLQIWTADESRQVSDTETLATGMIVKLIVNDVEHDRKFVIIKGDTNGDGEIDLFDAVKILNHYLGSLLNGPYQEAAYVSEGDTDIDLFDAVKILNHYLEKTLIHEEENNEKNK